MHGCRGGTQCLPLHPCRCCTPVCGAAGYLPLLMLLLLLLAAAVSAAAAVAAIVVVVMVVTAVAGGLSFSLSPFACSLSSALSYILYKPHHSTRLASATFSSSSSMHKNLNSFPSRTLLTIKTILTGKLIKPVLKCKQCAQVVQRVAHSAPFPLVAARRLAHARILKFSHSCLFKMLQLIPMYGQT